MLAEFPRPLASIVGEIIGGYYYHHQAIETLFYESGASGDPPEGNCVNKVTNWLVREGKSNPSKAIEILGKILEEFMDGDFVRNCRDKNQAIQRIVSALQRYGLTYGFGGKIYGASISTPSRSLADMLRELAIQEIDDEFNRAYQSVDEDPPSALTAACAIVEAMCKAYIAEYRLDTPRKQTIKNVWNVVSRHLGLSPDRVEEDDLKKILSGLTSITDGIGSLRTHAGSAHGHAKRIYRIEPRHARLAVHSAHTLCLFVLETWQKQRDGSRQLSG
ncbi:MAG: abortive infection family protein [Candidatus Electrothrix scaldis]|nr:MAG: abortive infection family protein [Candidatus Electrothrix sp. GW3-3]